MRGEETQLLGAIGIDERGVLAVLPGTHSKWARVEHGRVVDFTTFMTGELYGVLIDHSMLGRLAGHEPGRFSRDAFSRGVARGLDDGELAHDIFGARTLALTGALASERRRRLAVGTADRTRDARRARVGACAPASNRRSFASSAPTRSPSATSLRWRTPACSPSAGSADAAARGLWRIAARAGIVAAPVDA